PQAGGAGHPSLAAQLALDAHLAGDVGHLVGEDGEGLDHAVDGVGQGGDLALGVQRQLALQVAVGDGGDDLGDAAHLTRQVGGHRVDVVGQVLPGAGYAGDLRLAAQLALGADLARHAGDLRREGVELVHHGVDGRLQLEDLALHIDGDLLRQIALGHRRRHLDTAAPLTCDVAGPEVHTVAQVLPRALHAALPSLAAQLALGADLARHAGDLRGEGVQLVHHGVDGRLQFEDLALHVDGDLLRQVAIGHR